METSYISPDPPFVLDPMTTLAGWALDLGVDGQRAIGDRHVDILFLRARQVSSNDNRCVVFVNVEATVFTVCLWNAGFQYFI